MNVISLCGFRNYNFLNSFCVIVFQGPPGDIVSKEYFFLLSQISKKVGLIFPDAKMEIILSELESQTCNSWKLEKVM